MNKGRWLCVRHKIIRDPQAGAILMCPTCFGELEAENARLRDELALIQNSAVAVIVKAALEGK